MNFMVFLFHFLAAAGFTIFLYFGATYSSLKDQMKDLISLDALIQQLIETKASNVDIQYYQKQYREQLQEFEHRRVSWYSKALSGFCPSLRYSFKVW